eukprot:2254865-Prymnesium_polylepis.1
MSITRSSFTSCARAPLRRDAEPLSAVSAYHIFTPRCALLSGCSALFREFHGWGFTRFAAVSRRCFACDSRVVSRHRVLNATANGGGMHFHPFAKFSICSSHLPLQ